MVHDQVEDDAHPASMCLSDEPFHIFICAIWWVDFLVVSNVVSHVNLWRVVHGTDPDGVDTNRPDVVQFRENAIQVTNTITVRILEARRVDLVDDTIFPPLALGDCHDCVYKAQENEGVKEAEIGEKTSSMISRYFFWWLAADSLDPYTSTTTHDTGHARASPLHPTCFPIFMGRRSIMRTSWTSHLSIVGGQGLKGHFFQPQNLPRYLPWW